MIGFLFLLTLRQQAFRRSTLMLIGLALIPVLVAIVYRLADAASTPDRWTAVVLYQGLIVTAVLPLTALMYGTSVIGDELEDGTAVYLLTKPLPRWLILLPKLLAPWLLTCLLVVTSTVLSGLIAIQDGHPGVVFGAAAATAVGALVYTVVFVLLSVVTTHALIAGLVYMLIWEGAVSGIFRGVSYFSIRQYTIGLADWLAGKVPDTFNANVGGETALLLAIAVTVGATIWAVRLLERVEVRERA